MVRWLGSWKPLTREAFGLAPVGTPARSHPATQQPSHRAFTLIELLVVLTVMMLAALIAIPSFVKFQQGEQLNWAARRTMALATEARGLAVAGDTEAALAFETRSHGIRLQLSPPDASPSDPGESAPISEVKTPDARLLELPLDVEANLESLDGKALPEIHFYSDGRADSAYVRLSREGFAPIVMQVNPRTGRLTLRKEGP